MTTCSNCGQAVEAAARFCPHCGTRLVGGESQGDPLIGRTLKDKYRVLSRIGEGSMGTVYEAEHIGLKKKVALKLLHADLRPDDETLQRFQREGIAAGKFTHPNAIQVFDFDRTEDGTFFLAMELVDGFNLREFLDEEGVPSLATSVEIVRQALGAVSEAHAFGIVHRDLKPENIMVIRSSTGGLTIKVLDFGLSKLVDVPLEASLRTQPGRIMGTPLYMAPEQGVGGEVDHRSDLYALGLIFYELVSGQRPFQGKNLTELLVKQNTEPVPSLLDSHPDLRVPDELDELLRRTLQKKPEHRFQSAGEMLAALEAIDFQRAPSGRHRKRPAPPREEPAIAAQRPAESRPRRAVLLVGAVVVLGVVGVAWRFSGPGGSATAAEDGPARVREKAPEERAGLERMYVSLLNRARASLRTGNPETALVLAQEAAALPCRDAELYLVRGLAFLAQGDEDTARAELDEALELDPAYADAAAAVGWIELERGAHDAARARFETAAAGGDGPAEALAGLGALHYAQDELDEAEEQLAQAVARDGDCAPAHYYLGLVRLAREDFEGALAALVQAKRADSRDWRTLVALGEAHLALERYEDGENQLREAYRLASAELDPLAALATFLVDRQRYSEASELLAEPLERNPEHDELRLLHALALRGEGRAGEALAALEELTAASPGIPGVATLLGIQYQRAGQPEAALEQYELALDANPDDPVASLNRGLVLVELELFEDAAAAFEEAIDLAPEEPEPRLALGALCLEHLEDDARATEQLRRYVELGGRDPRVEGWLEDL